MNASSPSSSLACKLLLLMSCWLCLAHFPLAAILRLSSSSSAAAAVESISSNGNDTSSDGSQTIADAIHYVNYGGDSMDEEANVDIANEAFIHTSLRRRRRRLVSMSAVQDDEQLLLDANNPGNDDDNGIIINMMRRAKDHVSPTDVPFLLHISPHDITSASEVMYNILTQCYGLIGQRYDDDTVNELLEAKRKNVVDTYFLSTDYHFFRGVRPLQHQQSQRMDQSNIAKRQLQQRQSPLQQQQQQPFHFIATHHYQEGASLFTPKHRGRVIAVLEHPVIVVQKNFLAASSSSLHSSSAATSNQQQQQQQQDALLKQLIEHVNSTNYIDNTLTRMISNTPYPTPLTEDHFKYARMILENKFLIGMGYDMDETPYKRIKLYFGWSELEGKSGCEAEIMNSLPNTKINDASSTTSPSSVLVEEGSKIWRFIQRKNLYDMKLYARGMSIFADQKMRLPVHYSVRQREVATVQNAFFDGGNLRSVEEFREDSDIPFFWHIPKASGTTVKEILSDCYGLVRTEMIQPPSSLDVFHDKHVLNLDLSTPESIALAIKQKVADRGLADVFISQLSLEGSTVFSKSYHMGRAFTILRHPVKLAASLFYYRRIATWEPTYRPEYNNITLQEYVETKGYYDNWMVRMLSNAKIGGLNDSHLELAKRILKEKFVIGISDHMDETFRMLQVYYGWVETRGGCVNFHLHSAPSNKNKYPVPDNGGPVWAMIAEKNKYDMALYYYALELFGDQSMKMIFREG